jgi:flagellar biosynthetic protein FliO
MGDGMNLGLQLVRVIGSLALVTALVFLAAYGYRRWGQWSGALGGGAMIQVLARKSLSPKNQIMVVKVEDELFLLGTSAQGIQLLSPLAGNGIAHTDRISAADECSRPESPAGPPQAERGSSFQQLIEAASVLRRFRQ